MLLGFIRNRDMQLLSFMDHTPGQGQYRNLEFFKNHVMSQSQTEEEKNRILTDRMNRTKLTAEQLGTGCGHGGSGRHPHRLPR